VDNPLPLDEQRLPARVIEEVAQTRQTLLVTDTRAADWVHQDPYLGRSNVRSLLCVPVAKENTVVGVIYLQNDLMPGVFTRSTEVVVGVLATLAVLSLQNARLVRHLEAEVSSRTEQLRETQQRVSALERASLERQMAGGFAHEMRNALGTARLCVEELCGFEGSERPSLLARSDAALRKISAAVAACSTSDDTALTDVLEELTASMGTAAELITGTSEAIGRALDITTRILDYSRLDQARPGTERTRLRDIVQEVIAAHAERLRRADVRLEVDCGDDGAIFADRSHLCTILENLVANAIDALDECADARQRWVRISTASLATGVDVRIADNGNGMSPEVQARIFEPFFSTRPNRGLGLGMGIVKKLLDLYRGSIVVDSTPGEGTQFRVSLPFDVRS
jgi:signal transduction histidine kinase